MRAAQVGRTLAWVVALLIAGVLLLPQTGRAESSTVRLSVRRLNGADILGRIAGTFQLAVDAPEQTRLVTFYIDGRIFGRAASYPFVSVLDTRDFPQGEHQIEAVAHLSDGSVTASNAISLDFRPRKWHLAVRQAMFLYAGLVLVLGIAGGVVVHQLLRIQPRLVLLDR